MNEETLPNTLFTDGFPEVTTDEELIETIKKYPQYDPYYVTSGCIRSRREKIDKLWCEFNGMQDSQFLLQYKLLGKFHERTWEMYVGCILKKYFYNINPCLDDGPDFILTNELGGVYIEVTACKKGDGVDKVPDMIDGVVNELPQKEKLLRISSSLTTKANKYKEFISAQNKPFVIAINTGGLDLIETERARPLYWYLFGIGKLAQEFINKKNGEKILMGFFKDPNNSFVSAIIYSSERIINTPEDIGADCNIIYNPKAKCPISSELFSFLRPIKC